MDSRLAAISSPVDVGCELNVAGKPFVNGDAADINGDGARFEAYVISMCGISGR